MQRLERAFDAGSTVVVDLTEVEFMDSSVLRALAYGAQQAEQHAEHAIRIVARRDSFPRRLLALTGLRTASRSRRPAPKHWPRSARTEVQRREILRPLADARIPGMLGYRYARAGHRRLVPPCPGRHPGLDNGGAPAELGDRGAGPPRHRAPSRLGNSESRIRSGIRHRILRARPRTGAHAAEAPSHASVGPSE